jgi:hypothetical protein
VRKCRKYRKKNSTRGVGTGEEEERKGGRVET